MHVLSTKNTGPKGYWRFEWLRYKGQYSISWEKPIFTAALLQKNPELKLPFIKFPNRPHPEIYRPLEEAPGISREFIAIRDPEGALTFANRYGLLGLDSVPRYADHHDELDQNGENINDWIREAARLRQVYEVLGLADKPDGVGKIIAVTPSGVPFIWLDTGRGRSRHPSARGLKAQEKMALARDFIAETYNRNMIQMASPTLLLDANGRFHLHNRPSSLLGALWLEFGEVASGARKQCLCESCGQWMDVTSNRGDKRKHDRCILRDKMARYRAKLKNLPAVAKSKRK